MTIDFLSDANTKYMMQINLCLQLSPVSEFLIINSGALYRSVFV